MENGILKGLKHGNDASDFDQLGVKTPARSVNGNGARHAAVPPKTSNGAAFDSGLISAIIQEHFVGRDGFKLGDHDLEKHTRIGQTLDSKVGKIVSLPVPYLQTITVSMTGPTSTIRLYYGPSLQEVSRASD